MGQVVIDSSFVTIETLREALVADVASGKVGTAGVVATRLHNAGHAVSDRHLARGLTDLFPRTLTRVSDAKDHAGESVVASVATAYEAHMRSARHHLFFADIVDAAGRAVLLLSDRRGFRLWCAVESVTAHAASQVLAAIAADTKTQGVVLPVGRLHAMRLQLTLPPGMTLAPDLFPPGPYTPAPATTSSGAKKPEHQHLDTLEAESIRIIREAVAVAQRPGMLFSMGKDSMVMWTLAKKAFYPEPPPFPLLVIDTQWKFRDMYRFRDYVASQDGVDLRVHINPDAIRDNVNPFDQGSAVHTDITKTQALKQVLDTNRFDFVFGGARRDEEKSRAKERVFSLRTAAHGWDPKNQRPELWNVYNTRLMPGQSMRVFPLSNWTELDIWRYIERENIDVVPLYFSKTRPLVERNGALIMVDDERFPLEEGEKIMFEPIRFRTLGCYPLTGGVRSPATTVAEIIAELEDSRVSERSSRVIDFDPGASMEQKKKEGYF